MFRNLILITAVYFFSSVACKSDAEKNGNAKDLTWYKVDDISRLQKTEKKGFFIDVYTEWCGWCKKMDKVTFSDPSVKAALAKKYHVIKFDAEQKSPVDFNGGHYTFIPQGRNGINTLAVELLQNELSFPSYVFLDEDLKLKKVTRGFMTVEDFLKEI